MNSFATLALAAWVPATFLLFLALPKRRALVLSVIGGFFFLPCGSIKFPGLSDFNKQMVTCLGPGPVSLADLIRNPQGHAKACTSGKCAAAGGQQY